MERVGMISIREVTKDELLRRREKIVENLRARGMSLEQLSEYARLYSLAGDEYEIWEQLSAIAYLLGESD
jgi:hypothetical protein